MERDRQGVTARRQLASYLLRLSELSNNRVAAGGGPSAGGARRLSGAEEGEAAAGGRCGGGLSSPTSKETQSLSDFCSGSESAASKRYFRALKKLRAILAGMGIRAPEE